MKDIFKFIKRLKIKKDISYKEHIKSFKDKILIKKVKFTHKNKKDSQKIFETFPI